MPVARERKPLKMNMVDKTVAYFSPKSALGNLQARAALNSITSSFGVQKTGASNKGTLSNWFTRRLSRFTESQERETTVDRAEDLIANDPHAVSVVEGMGVNITGTGIKPQSRPNFLALGVKEEDTEEFQHQCEWAFKLWSKKADASNRLNFNQMQFTTILSMLGPGEAFRLPVTIKDDPARKFSMALQAVSPLRCFTPRDKIKDPNIRDGIVLGGRSEPKGYWFANPKGEFYSGALSSNQCEYKRATIGHRPGVLHPYIQKRDEQIRGDSILAPAMKFFRDLSDYLDFEVVGSIVAASTPIFIETSDPYGAAQGAASGDENDAGQIYQNYNPGQVMYGKQNQRPHILKNDRPGSTFASFVERILRAVGASVGMPYEIIAKDFSKTNYSSARAALLEAWRVFSFYQSWLIAQFCQPVWEMVIEEAYLRDMITLPKGAPDFYEAREAYTNANWIPPRKGHVDPAKEIGAYIDAKNENIMTQAAINAEVNGSDWEEDFVQRGKERQMERDEKIVPPDVESKSAKALENDKEEKEDGEEDDS